MQINIDYSELLLERGSRDPLGIWTVGDRLSRELLPPFNTVVTQRPARYFSMYSWLFKETSRQCADKTEKEFWWRFFELEAIFLISIQFHDEHNYKDISGNIGSDHCKEILKLPRNKDTINFTELKIKNAWERNYNKSMSRTGFGLFESDYGLPWKLRLTEKGEKLAKLYENSIAPSNFIKKHRSKKILPREILHDLSNYSCPCLIHTPRNSLFMEERNGTVNWLISNAEKTDTLLYDSIKLILDYLTQESGGTRNSWRAALSTGLLDKKIPFNPSSELQEIFKIWKLYTLDSLFVYALESGLHNFLNVLDSSGSRIHKKKLSKIFNKSLFDKIMDKVNRQFDIDRNDIINSIEIIDSQKQFELEKFLINQISDSMDTPLNSIFYAYLLFGYAQAVFNEVEIDAEFENAVKFYSERAWHKGNEQSLLFFSQLPNSNVKADFDFFYEHFLLNMVINRSLSIRTSRHKQIAWFSDTGTEYEWENCYNPGCYRAARFDNILSCLYNLNIIENHDGKWFIDNDEPSLEELS